MSQDQIVADFANISTTETQTLIGQILNFHSALGTNLFACAELDDEHRATLAATDKSKLIALRNRIDLFYPTLRAAIAAGSF